MEGGRGRFARRTIQIPKCYCGLSSSLKTSRTDNNLARRFVACPLGEVKGCRFWQWYDPDMCPRVKDVIPGLLQRIDCMEKQVEMLENEGKIWRSKVKKMEMKVHKLEAELVKSKRRELYLSRGLIIVGIFVILAVLNRTYNGKSSGNLALPDE